ncbi:MAG: ABC transporter permease [Thermomicrobiales bacterium]|nr:ABC transporter permease [Thermomicrobiales bacterium]
MATVARQSALLPRERTAPSRWRQLWSFFRDPAVFLSSIVLGLVLLAAIAPSVLQPFDPNKIGVGPALVGPNRTHLFGTDDFGRDIFSRAVDAARLELTMSIGGVALAVLIGVPLGLVAGYRGGLADSLLMRIQDAMLAFPSILFAILVVAALGASQRSIVLTVGAIFIPRFARLVRGSVLTLKEEEFVLASRAVGATPTRVMARHILPNCIAPILVQITLTVSVAILIEAGLSYLGLGVQPPAATWGNMLKQAQSFPRQAPWYVIAPGACIFFVVLSLNLLGDALRDRLDPRLRRL